MNRNVIPVLVAFILLAVIGIYVLSTKNRQNVTTINILPTPTTVLITPTVTKSSPSPTISQTTFPRGGLQTRPMQVTDDFYSWYLACSKQGACEYKTSNDIDKNQLPENIGTKFVGGNPIICGQNPPQSYTVLGLNNDQSNEATVYVNEDYGSGKTVQVTVMLKLENGEWKITNIACPTP